MEDISITEDDARRARRAYYGAIAYLDEQVGLLLAVLETFGLKEDTVVILTSDHGDMLGERGLWYKMCFFGWAVRVPLILEAPGRIAPQRVAAPVSLVDLLPTLLELGRPEGGAAPEIEGDGASLLPLLDGGEGSGRTVLGEYLAEGALAPILMIRRGTHKFVWSEPDPPMLFDLARDPDELDDLAGRDEHANTVRALEAEVHERWDPRALREAVLRSQRARRLAFQALSAGRHTSWDYQPVRDASREYMRNHLDLNDLERTRRYPPVE